MINTRSDDEGKGDNRVWVAWDLVVKIMFTCSIGGV